MTDPRYTDPHYNVPPREQFSDPLLRRSDPSGSNIWGWIAGIAVVLIVGFLLVAGRTSNNNSASMPAASTTGSATHEAPLAPAPAPTPAPTNPR